MKYIGTTIIIAALMAVGSMQIAEAHMSAGSAPAEGQSQVTEQEFEEMQDTMIKMMNGERLSQGEAEEMNEFMAGHQGSFVPMMHGYGSDDGWNRGFGGGMMQGGWMGGAGMFWSWIMGLAGLVWLLVGILLVVFLFKKISTPKPRSDI